MLMMMMIVFILLTLRTIVLLNGNPVERMVKLLQVEMKKDLE
jgi:hypothetical protein